jgi:hypothetical protein
LASRDGRGQRPAGPGPTSGMSWAPDDQAVFLGVSRPSRDGSQAAHPPPRGERPAARRRWTLGGRRPVGK